jgi:hypothetical protein
MPKKTRLYTRPSEETQHSKTKTIRKDGDLLAAICDGWQRSIREIKQK